MNNIIVKKTIFQITKRIRNNNILLMNNNNKKNKFQLNILNNNIKQKMIIKKLIKKLKN